VEDESQKVVDLDYQLVQTQPNYCSTVLFNLIQQSFHLFDPEALSQLLQTQFYNAEILKTMTCLINTILTDELAYNEFLKDNKVLTFKKKPDLIVFFSKLIKGKYPSLAFKYDQNDTNHEAVIGLFGINKVREVIPTFAWTYGVTTCDLPVFDENDKMVTACQKKVDYYNNDYIGLITEYIRGPTLQKYIKDMNVAKLISCLLTVSYSLKYANEMIEYVHWDLHVENIIMRELENNNSYLYLPNEKKYLWVGQNLATIIDYGFNSMNVKDDTGSTYFTGALVRPELGISPLQNTSPLNDLYKLMGSLYYYLNKNKSKVNSQVYQLFIKLYIEFLGMKDQIELEEAYAQSISNNYSIFPNNKKDKIENFIPFTIDTWIARLEALVPPGVIITQKPPTQLIISCQGGATCLNEKGILEDIFPDRPIQDDILMLQILPNVIDQASEKDLKIFGKVFEHYLDDIFNQLEKYKNIRNDKSLELIFIFNAVRIIEMKLGRILELIYNVKGLEDVKNRALKFYEVLADWVMEYQKSTTLSFMNYTLDEFKPKIKAAELYKMNARKSLNQSFIKLINEIRKVHKDMVEKRKSEEYSKIEIKQKETTQKREKEIDFHRELANYLQKINRLDGEEKIIVFEEMLKLVLENIEFVKGTPLMDNIKIKIEQTIRRYPEYKDRLKIYYDKIYQ
jgi:hypothetical protein